MQKTGLPIVGTTYTDPKSALALAIAQISSTGWLIRQLERDEPFVANLRLQWLRVMASRRARGLTVPIVVQMLGNRDDLVSEDDSRDVTVAQDFIWVKVHNSGHADILNFEDPENGN